MLLIFRDAFAVSVAFGVPDLTVVEVVSFDVLFVEGDGRDCFDSKNGCIRTGRFGRFGEWAGFLHNERIVGMELLDGREYLHEVLIHRFRNIESDGRCRASVAVEQVGDFI